MIVGIALVSSKDAVGDRQGEIRNRSSYRDQVQARTRDEGAFLALTELGEKPIQTLTPMDARRQPTMEDAVNVVLKKMV